MVNRIYAVSNKADGTHRLVRAGNPAQALRHVANGMFGVKVATASVVATLMSAGISLEDVIAEPEAQQKEEP